MNDQTKLLLKQTTRVAAPIALQNLFLSGLNMVDTVMIGQLGDVEMAAVALANQITFLQILFLFGLSSGTGIFTAQYWGQRNLREVRRAMGLCWGLSMAGALAFFCAGFFFPRQILEVFTQEADVLYWGALYLKKVSPVFIASALSVPFSIVLRSIQRTGSALLASVFSLGLNTLLNYLLIFGVGPFPALGVEGAALATAVARFSEFLFFLILHKVVPNPLFGPVSHYLGYSRAYLRRYLGRVMPVVINEMLWALGMTQYFVVYGRMGTESVAAMNIVDTFVRLMLFAFIGFGSAVAALIGEMIGQNDLEKVKKASGLFLFWNLLMALFFSALSLAAAPLVPLFFQISPLTSAMSVRVIRLFALFLLFKTTNLVIVVGLLRGGGDTRFSLFFDMFGVWGMGVPLCYITGLVLGLPLWGVYIALNAEEVVKSVVGMFRVFSWRWIHNVTEPEEIPVRGN